VTITLGLRWCGAAHETHTVELGQSGGGAQRTQMTPDPTGASNGRRWTKRWNGLGRANQPGAKSLTVTWRLEKAARHRAVKITPRGVEVLTTVRQPASTLAQSTGGLLRWANYHHAPRSAGGFIHLAGRSADDRATGSAATIRARRRCRLCATVGARSVRVWAPGGRNTWSRSMVYMTGRDGLGKACTCTNADFFRRFNRPRIPV